MIRFASLALLVALALPFAGGCKKDEPQSDLKADKPAEDVTWPTRDVKGPPVAVEFVTMIGEGKRRGATVRVFNFEDTVLARLDATLHYLDATGKELKTFPLTSMSAGIAQGKGYATLDVGAFVPAETVRVNVTVNSAHYKDEANPRWTREGEKPPTIRGAP